MDHNTYVSSTAGGDCEGFACVENNGGIPTQPAGVFSAIKNNIIWGTTNNGSATFINKTGSIITAGAYTNVKNNGHFGVLSNPYVGSGTYPGRVAAAGFATPSTPGTGDVTSDAAFVDNTRNLLKFCQLHDASIMTYTDCVAKFATLNDASPVTWAVVPDLYAWVRTGFTPTNSAYFTAGDDGSTLGAVPATGTVITDVKVSPTQIRIAFTAPDSSACRIRASRDSMFTVLAPDVDPALFTNANLSTRAGTYTDPSDATKHVFILGTRTIQQALNGNNVSRSLFQLTPYFIEVGCGASYAFTATATATTDYPTYGRSTRDPWILDANHYALWPTFDYNDRSFETAEPFTGALIKQLGLPQDVRRVALAEGFDSCAVTTGWSGCGVLTSGDSTYAGTTQQPLALKLPTFPYTPPFSAFTEDYESFDGTLNPADGNWTTATLPTSSGTTDIGTRVVGSLLGAQFRPHLYQEWGAGYLYNSGSSTTVNFTDVTDCNRIVAGEESLTIFDATAIVTVSKNCGGSPPSMVISSPVNLDPSPYTGAVGWPFRYYAGFEYNPRLRLLIRKHSTTASNTLHLTGLTWDSGHGGNSGNTSGGFSEFGSQFVDSNSWRKLRAISKIYSYDPASGAGAYIGQTVGIFSSGLIASSDLCSTPSGYQSWKDGDTIYFVCARASDSKYIVVRGVLTGNAANDIDNQPTGNTNTVAPDGMTWTAMSGDIVAAAKAYDSSYDDTNDNQWSLIGFSGGRYLHIHCDYAGGGTQDTLTTFVVYDLNNGLPIGSGGNGAVIAAWNPSLGPGESAWSVMHTGFQMGALDNSTPVNFYVWQGKPGKNEGTANGLYSFTYSGQYWNGSMFVSGDMPNPCAPCRIKISGTPTASVTPTTLKDIAVDEVIMMSGGGNKEFFKVTAVSASDDITITGPFDTNPDFPARAWPSGTFGYMQPWWGLTAHLDENGNADSMRWDFLSEPHGPAQGNIYVSTFPGGGHSVNYDMAAFGAACLSGVITPAGSFADRSGFPYNVNTFTNPCDLPYFGTNHYAPQYGDLAEGHPSYKPTPWPVAIDSAPNVGHAFGMNNLTWDSGNRFELVYNEIASSDATADGLSRKWFPSHVSGHSRIFEDISGPGSVLGTTTADSFKYCVALLANECKSGSTPGKTYINDPYVVPTKFNVSDGSECTINGQVWGDVCFADFAPRMASISAYGIPTTATPATSTPFFSVLEQTGMCSRPCRGNTDNGKLLYGNWFYYVFEAQTKGQLATSSLVKIPDTAIPTLVDNSVFSETTVTASSVPALTDNVLVEFGYAEYGAVTAYQCTSRLESCVANSATLSQSAPFVYPTEGSGGVLAGVTGVSCAVSCSVAVPTIPGYIVYPKLIYRKSDNSIISTLVLPPSGGTAPAPPPTGVGGTIIGGKVTIGGKVSF